MMNMAGSSWIVLEAKVDSSASPAPGFPNSLQSQLPSHSALDRFEERHRRQYSGTCLHLRSNMDEKCIRDVINGNPVTVLPDLKAGSNLIGHCLGKDNPIEPQRYYELLEKDAN